MSTIFHSRGEASQAYPFWMVMTWLCSVKLQVEDSPASEVAFGGID